MQVVLFRPAAAHAPADQPHPERDKHRCHVETGPDDREAAQKDADPSNAKRTHSAASIARLRYAWRCSSCRRILMRHHMPLKAIAGLVGPLHIRCHCNHDNWLQ